MNTRFVVAFAIALALAGCGGSDKAAQQAKEDAEWKANVAKAEADRIAEEKALTDKAIREHAESEAKDAADEKATRDEEVQANVDKMTERMRSAMFDPAAAQFRNVRLSRDGNSLCGEVNGKNKFGAYIGFKHFIVMANTPIVEDADTMYRSIAPTIDCP